MTRDTKFKDRLLGGLYGLLIGDAVGMPYEFRRPQNIPPLDQIDMIAPEGYNRAWKEIPYGSWTDDGSQALCLLEYYTEKQPEHDWVQMWSNKLLKWYFSAHLWVDNKSFDAGMQTRTVLQKIMDGTPALEAANPHDPSMNGNGSLMRCLPTVLWNSFQQIPIEEVMADVENISRITHAHARSRYACVFYSVIAYNLLAGMDFDASLSAAESYMTDKSHGYDQGEWSIIAAGERSELTGSGYVVNSLWTAIECVRTTTSYKDCIKKAIWYGNDTDTTACIAGGLAGIKYGRSGIPMQWYEGLRAKDVVMPLAEKLLNHHGLN